MNLLEQQTSNRRRTWIVMALFVGFLLFLGFGFDLFVLDLQSAAVPVGSMAALAGGSVSAMAAYFGGDRAVLLSTGAQPLASLRAAAPPDEALVLRQLDNVVEEMAIAAGLPKPHIYVVPDPDPNAFATGRDPAHASIAVTRGLLDLLTRDELQAVVAHEMSHVRNYDIRLMTIVAALVGSTVLLADWAARGLRFGGGRTARRRTGRRSDGGNAAAVLFLVVWIAAIALTPLLARLLAMAVSRRREYLADASAAELTRNPLALADALHRIEFVTGPTKSMKRGTAHLCIADPLGRSAPAADTGTRADQGSFWQELFLTHPPMSKRIAALKAMAYQR